MRFSWKTLGRDLRVLDAHAGLGNIIFERSPERALVHYEIGVRIGELSIPEDFDGLLVWGRVCNRAFLRCLLSRRTRPFWRVALHAKGEKWPEGPAFRRLSSAPWID